MSAEAAPVSGGKEDLVTVARLDELPEEEGVVVSVEGREIALFRVGDEVFAIDDTCPHQDASLAEGDVEDTTIMCPLHGWTFDLRTGDVLNGEKCTVVHPVRIVDGNVQVRVSS